MNLRYLAAGLTVGQALIWLVIQPGFPLMDGITGEDDGDILQGLAMLVPATILAWRFATSRGLFGFLAWNAVWVVLWSIYSTYHLERWESEEPGNVWLLLPELFVALHAVALVLGLVALVRLIRDARSTA
jgi:hypothetical protein